MAYTRGSTGHDCIVHLAQSLHYRYPHTVILPEWVRKRSSAGTPTLKGDTIISADFFRVWQAPEFQSRKPEIPTLIVNCAGKTVTQRVQDQYSPCAWHDDKRTN